jgi:hypothetical protein
MSTQLPQPSHFSASTSIYTIFFLPDGSWRTIVDAPVFVGFSATPTEGGKSNFSPSG